MFAELIESGIAGMDAPMAACYRGNQPVDGWCINTGGMPKTGGCRIGMLPENGVCVIGAVLMGA